MCGDAPSITTPIEYTLLCGDLPVEAASEITPADLRKKIEAREPVLILDVREPHEHALDAIDGSRLIPLGELGARIGELPADHVTQHGLHPNVADVGVLGLPGLIVGFDFEGFFRGDQGQSRWIKVSRA